MILMEREAHQAIWFNTMFGKYKHGNVHFENKTFEIIPYSYDEPQEYNFWHKPSGFKMSWYKYPLRSPECNFHISYHEFYTVLEDCMNSVPERKSGTVTVHYEIDEWWKRKGKFGDPIYTVLVYRDDVSDGRLVGYYNSFDEAESAVKNNACDIKECVYNHAVIEEVYPGLYNDIGKVFFYKEKGDGFTRINRPKEYMHYCNFTIG